MMSTKNIIKYGLLWGLLIWAMVVRGQQVEILHEGEDAGMAVGTASVCLG